MKKVIISCAITGGAHTPSMSPHLPITPDQIAEHSIAAAEAGAAIVHLHARDPETGKPSGSPEIFLRFLERIKSASDVVINLSTGAGGPGMPISERTLAARTLKPEMCSLNMGSINLNLSEMGQRERDWKFDWEKPHLLATNDLVFRNTFAEIEWILEHVGREGGTRFEFECYDVSHLYTLAYLLDRGLVKPPLFVQTVFGLRGAIGAHVEDLMHQRRTADRLFGDDYQWSLFAAGKNQMPFATIGALMGSHVRVGLEDSLYISHGELATSNAQQVGKIRHIVEELGLQIATAAETRVILGLKGRDHVGF